jgi:hypothetical protein
MHARCKVQTACENFQRRNPTTARLQNVWTSPRPSCTANMSSSNPYTGELFAAHGILGLVFMHLSAVLKPHTGGQRGRLPSVAALSAACKNRCDRLARGDLKSLLERAAADGDKFQLRLLRILVAMRGLGACDIEARYDGETLPAFLDRPKGIFPRRPSGRDSNEADRRRTERPSGMAGGGGSRGPSSHLAQNPRRPPSASPRVGAGALEVSHDRPGGVMGPGEQAREELPMPHAGRPTLKASGWQETFNSSSAMGRSDASRADIRCWSTLYLKHALMACSRCRDTSERAVRDQGTPYALS